LVVSIENQAQTPLVIPLINDFPQVGIDAAGSTPRKYLFMRLPGNEGSWFTTSVVKLEAGKIITLTHNYRISDINKDEFPMIITVNFMKFAGAPVPLKEHGLVLESVRTVFPK
jgi:hypothetical protein